jgi:hypothetical protein
MKKKLVLCFVAMTLLVGAASAQFGGVVYDPTNYHNAVLRYIQLQQHLVQLKNSYSQLVAQYNLALQMARNIHNMPVRYRALFSQWRNVAAQDTYSNTTGWVNGANTGNLLSGYEQATTQLQPYDANELMGMPPDELSRAKSQYASVELADGANFAALSAIGAIRNSAQDIQTKMANLEDDSLSDDPNLNTQVGVLNKMNAAAMLTLRTLQDSNKLLTSILEEQTILAKDQREITTNSINADITRYASLLTNMQQVTSTLTDSLQTFRMP